MTVRWQLPWSWIGLGPVGRRLSAGSRNETGDEVLNRCYRDAPAAADADAPEFSLGKQLVTRCP